MISDRLQPFGTTIFTEMTRLAAAHGAVNLAQGFPDFEGLGMRFVHEAAIAAIREGKNQYARMFGMPALNAAIAGWCARGGHDVAMTVDPEREVTVTSGCTEAIAAAMLGLVNAGDEVILFEPYYDSYRASVAMAGATPRFIALRPQAGAGGFAFDEAELRAAFTGRTRAILINTPHNPTGKVFSRAELELIAELCIKHGVIALVDEVYERLTYDPAKPHIRLATLGGGGMRERTVTLSSLGKTFSLTGWKIGWAAAPAELTAGVRAAHQFLTFATATPLQFGAAAALDANGPGEGAIRELVSHFQWARAYLAGALTDLGFIVHPCEGTYFLMADWRGSAVARAMGGMGGGGGEAAVADDVAFCRFLTEHAKVAAIPPSVFYNRPELGRSLARFAFCKRRETLEDAVRRLQTFASK